MGQASWVLSTPSSDLLFFLYTLDHTPPQTLAQDGPFKHRLWSQQTLVPAEQAGGREVRGGMTSEAAETLTVPTEASSCHNPCTSLWHHWRWQPFLEKLGTCIYPRGEKPRGGLSFA